MKAYADLNTIIAKYKKIVLSLEKQRLAKERIFYLNEENQLKYQQALAKLDTLEEDVTDNLLKMAHHALGVSFDKLREAGNAPVESIEERVSQADAERYLDLYKKLKM